MAADDLAEFLRRHFFTQEEFDRTGLDWDELREIREHHASMATSLLSVGTYVSERLQQLSDVHSLKVRVKDPEHLIAKIVRKKCESPELSIGLEDYRSKVTDLVGLRALHLFKDQWRPIHDFVTESWELNEEPIAYYRAGDPDALLKAFEQAGCAVTEHPYGYRSIHYVIKSQPDKELRMVELQVRTIFEEGWSEIDHSVRYPRLSSDPYLMHVLTIFNRLAGSSDEMGTFIKGLGGFLAEQSDALAERDERLGKAEADLKAAVSELQVSKSEKDKLEKKIEGLRRSSQVVAGSTFPMSAGLGSLSGAALDIGRIGTVEKTCSRCGKEYRASMLGSSFYPFGTDLCPECRGKHPGSASD